MIFAWRISIPYLISYCHPPDCRSENGGIYGRWIVTEYCETRET